MVLMVNLSSLSTLNRVHFPFIFLKCILSCGLTIAAGQGISNEGVHIEMKRNWPFYFSVQ